MFILTRRAAAAAAAVVSGRLTGGGRLAPARAQGPRSRRQPRQTRGAAWHGAQHCRLG
jgi:hypothetical protein